jgi:hypothetical protein
MKKTLLLMLVATCACSARADAIQIHGIRLGMTQKEFGAAQRRDPRLGVSILGAKSRKAFGAPEIVFRDGRLEQFSAYFSAQDFNRIRTAVQAGNPAIRCTLHENVSVCYDEEQTFSLTRVGDVAMLLLQTRRAADEAERAIRDMSLEGEASPEM